LPVKTTVITRSSFDVLLSMTGFGEARRQENEIAVAVELRTVNNRYFKFSLRISEGYGSLEPHIESAVRQQIKRGTLNASIRIDRLAAPEDNVLNLDVLHNYRKQIELYQAERQLPRGVAVEHLLSLPGVIREPEVTKDLAESARTIVEATVHDALATLAEFRAEEGRAMQSDMSANCEIIGAELAKIAMRAPLLVDNYRNRLHERVASLLEEYQVSLQPADLVREVSIFAERSDISEEIVRLRSHLEQFAAIMAAEESAGRKLEFVIQEMFREVNTIGSKSSDVEVARGVIEMKTAIERLREMIQNVE
jgi:uncharacterized protein (TIGR00255 family)